MRVVGSKGLKTHSDLVEELEEALKVMNRNTGSTPLLLKVTQYAA